MKLRHISAAVMALASAQAFAIAPGTAVDVTVYSAGSSANRAVVAGLILQNCQSNIDVYYSSIAAGGDFTSDAANGDSHRVYSCTLKTVAQGIDTEFTAFAGKTVRFFKRDSGGSGIGVFNLALGTAAALDTTSCIATGSVYPAVPQYLCTKNSAATTPLHLGLSDVEPALFKGINTPAGFNTAGADTTGVTITALNQTIFGVAVNNQLRNALQTAQSLTVGDYAADLSNMPSVPSAVVGSMLRGELQDPVGGLGWHAFGVANPTNQVNICRRAPGSGTQAAANAVFAGFPCETALKSVATNADSGLPNTLAVGNFSGNGFFVYEGGSTGNVISCLTAAQGVANTYAIGHVSVENASNGSWNHVKLDGIAPTRANATGGKYAYVYELTAQYKPTFIATLPGSAGAFITQFIKAAQTPLNLSRLATTTQAGIAALPAQGTYNPNANQANILNGGDLTRFISRMSRGGNSCTSFSVVQ